MRTRRKLDRVLIVLSLAAASGLWLIDRVTGPAFGIIAGVNLAVGLGSFADSFDEPTGLCLFINK